MYNEKDISEINGRIVKYSIVLVVATLIVAVPFVLSMALRWGEWVKLFGALVFVVFTYVWCAHLYPCIRYHGFLTDMKDGLSRDMDAEILEVAEKEELQDHVRVYPVHILVQKDQEERIVYINVSKAEGFPKAGSMVHLDCFGRHIKQVTKI